MLRRFHAPAAVVMVPTPTIRDELTQRGFARVKVWSRGVDHQAVPAAPDQRPRFSQADLSLCRPRRGGEKSRRPAQPEPAGLDGDRRRRAGARRARAQISPCPFPRRPLRRSARASLCQRRRFRLPEPHRHVRHRAHRSPGERPAGRRLSGRRTARRDRRQRRRGFERRPRRGLPAGAGNPARPPPARIRCNSPGPKARGNSSDISRAAGRRRAPR